MPCSSRTPYGTALYVKENVDVLSESVRCNYNDVEITLLRLNQPIHNLNIVEIYRSKSKVKISKFIEALKNLFLAAINDPNAPVIIIGDFNINFMENASDKKSLCKYLIEENKFTQLIHEVTTDYKTQIDHIFTNIPERVKNSGVLESYCDVLPLYFWHI